MRISIPFQKEPKAEVFNKFHEFILIQKEVIPIFHEIYQKIIEKIRNY